MKAEAAAAAAREAAVTKERDDKRRRMEQLVTGGAGSVSSSASSGATVAFGTVHVVKSLPELTALLATRDAVVCVDYMAPWCGPCRQMAPAYSALAAEMRDVVFVKASDVLALLLWGSSAKNIIFMHVGIYSTEQCVRDYQSNYFLSSNRLNIVPPTGGL